MTAAPHSWRLLLVRAFWSFLFLFFLSFLSFLSFFFLLFFFLEFVAYDVTVPGLELCGRQREGWKPKTEEVFRRMPLRYQSSLWVICTWRPAW